MITKITKKNVDKYDFNGDNLSKYRNITILAIDGDEIYIVARQYNGEINQTRIFTHSLFGQMSRYADIREDSMIKMLQKLLGHGLSLYACDTKKDVINLLQNKVMEYYI